MNYRIAGDEASNSIGDLQGVARAVPDDLHLVHIELGPAPLLRQMIHALHFHREAKTLAEIEHTRALVL